MIIRKSWTKWLIISFPIILFAYIGIYLFLYSIKDQQTNQYRSTSLPNDFKFSFNEPVEELMIKSLREAY